MKDQLTMQSTLLTTPSQYQNTSQELAMTIARSADDRKGDNIVILRVAEVSYLADYFVIVTGFSRIQVRAIQGWIEEEVDQFCQRLPIRTEGKADSSWILQDYGDVMVHIMLPQEREFYNLEAFWGHADKIEFHSQQPQS